MNQTQPASPLIPARGQPPASPSRFSSPDEAPPSVNTQLPPSTTSGTKNFSRVATRAWLVVWTAFAIFCILTVSIPLSIRWFWLTATVEQEVTLEVIAGTVAYKENGQGAWLAVDQKQQLGEGDVVRTDDTSRALLTFRQDGSTVTIFPRTVVTLTQVRRKRFSTPADYITLEQGLIRREELGSKGESRIEEVSRTRIAVAPHLETVSPLTFTVKTPHATAWLHPDGSYSVEVDARGTQLTVRTGSGNVAAGGQVQPLAAGERAEVLAGQQPRLQQASRQLIANGDFSRGLAGWIQYSDLEKKDDVPAGLELLTDDTGPVVAFRRYGSRNSHADVSLVQPINRDVSDFVSLKLSLDVYITYQSLSGGGYQGSEYPTIIRLRYRDAEGGEVVFVRGFYIHNQANFSTTNGEQIPQNFWYGYESKNLLSMLDGLSPRPFYLISISVGASGWDFESRIRSISLVGE